MNPQNTEERLLNPSKISRYNNHNFTCIIVNFYSYHQPECTVLGSMRPRSETEVQLGMIILLYGHSYIMLNTIVVWIGCMASE